MHGLTSPASSHVPKVPHTATTPDSLHFFEYTVFLALLNLSACRCLYSYTYHPHMGLAITSVLRAQCLSDFGSPQCPPLSHTVLTHSVYILLHCTHYSVTNYSHSSATLPKTAGNTYLEGRELFYLSLSQTIQYSASRGQKVLRGSYVLLFQ